MSFHKLFTVSGVDGNSHEIKEESSPMEGRKQVKDTELSHMTGENNYLVCIDCSVKKEYYSCKTNILNWNFPAPTLNGIVI